MNPSQDYGAGAANDARNQGQGAINNFDPTSVANSQRTNVSGLGNLLGGQTRDYVNRFSQAVSANPTVTSLYNTANDMFNVPGLANTANYLQNQVTNALPTGYQGAKGFDIGNTAVQNGVANKLSYLTPQSNAATNNLNTAQGLASQYVQAGQAQNAQNLLPIQAEQQNLLQQQAAESTGWNNAAQSEFQGLLAKMQSGVQLSQQEMDRANQLAAQETSYQNTLTQAGSAQNIANIGARSAQQVANIGAGSAQNVARLNNQYQQVGNGNTLANTFTGSIINPGILSRGSGYYGGR